jgi:hypothetical protein
MRKVELHVHLEGTDDPTSPIIWWADTDDFPGFSAAADHLNELLKRSEVALVDLAGEDVEVHPTMVPNDEPISAPSITLTGDLTFNEDGEGNRTVQVFPPTRTTVPA